MTARSFLNLHFCAVILSLTDMVMAGSAIANSQATTSPIQQVVKDATPVDAATPRNDPSTWVTLNDYPTDTHQQGTTRYRLLIAPTGRVARCEITASSGSKWLDEATCRNLTRRARFAPATNSKGEAIDGTYEGMMRWYIPD